MDDISGHELQEALRSYHESLAELELMRQSKPNTDDTSEVHQQHLI